MRETGALAQLCNCAFPLLMSDPRCSVCLVGQRRPSERREDVGENPEKVKKEKGKHFNQYTDTGTQREVKQAGRAEKRK